MKHLHIGAGAVAGYVIIGVGVAAWTASRAAKKQKAFNGLTVSTSPTMALVQTVALWPYAVVYNLKK